MKTVLKVGGIVMAVLAALGAAIVGVLMLVDDDFLDLE